MAKQYPEHHKDVGSIPVDSAFQLLALTLYKASVKLEPCADIIVSAATRR